MSDETWVNPFNEDGSINESLLPKSHKKVDVNKFKKSLEDLGCNITEVRSGDSSQPGRTFRIDDDLPPDFNDNDTISLY